MATKHILYYFSKYHDAVGAQNGRISIAYHIPNCLATVSGALPSDTDNYGVQYFQTEFEHITGRFEEPLISLAAYHLPGIMSSTEYNHGTTAIERCKYVIPKLLLDGMELGELSGVSLNTGYYEAEGITYDYSATSLTVRLVDSAETAYQETQGIKVLDLCFDLELNVVERGGETYTFILSAPDVDAEASSNTVTITSENVLNIGWEQSLSTGISNCTVNGSTATVTFPQNTESSSVTHKICLSGVTSGGQTVYAEKQFTQSGFTYTFTITPASGTVEYNVTSDPFTFTATNVKPETVGYDSGNSVNTTGCTVDGSNHTGTVRFSTNSSTTQNKTIVLALTGTTTVGTTVSATTTITQLYNESPSYTLSVSPTSATSPASGRTVTLTVQSNQTWTVSKNQTWATLSTTSGSGNGTVDVTIPNYTNTELNRSVTITFTGNDGQVCTSTITQERYVPPTPPTHSLSVPDYDLSFSSDGGKQNIRIVAIGQGWYVNSDEMPDYITLDAYSGSETSSSGVQVGVTCEPNTGDARSEDNLFVYGDGGYGDKDWFEVSQESYVPPTPDVLTITIEDNTIAYNETTNVRAYLNGTEVTSDSRLVFSSDDTSVATISNSTGTKGRVSGVASGSTNISATYNSLTSNSIQLTVTGGTIDPYDPSNWSWYDIRIVTGTTSAQTAVTQTIHVSESSELIAIAHVRDLDITIDVTSESVFSFRNGSGTGSISNEYFNAESVGTAEIEATYRTTTHSLSYVTIVVEPNRDLYLDIQPVGGTELQSGTTETITFKALILDRNDQSYSEDVTSDCVWSIVSGGRYAETGTTKGDVRLKENPASNTDGTVRAVYSIDLVATEDFTILHKDEPQVDELVSITLSIISAPDIPASGGAVDCSNVTYKVTAHYSISPDSEVTNIATIINCSGVTAQSKGSTVTGETIEGTLTMEVSYSEGGITKTDTGSIDIYQEENRVERTWSTTGKTENTQHDETITGDSSYSISCDEDRTVDYNSGSFQINVYPFKDTPLSAITFETYKETTTPYTSYTSNYVYTGATTTGTTVITGETTVTREWTAHTITEFDVEAGYQDWITNVVCHGGSQALGHGTADISYSEYSSGSDNRIGTIVFYIIEDIATKCTFKLIQTPPPTPTRTITIHFTDGLFKNDSDNSSIVSVHCEIVDDMGNIVGDVTWDNDVHPLEKGTSLYYPTEFNEEGHTPTTWDYSFDVQSDFNDRIWFTVTIDNIELSDGTTGSNPNPEIFYINITTSQDDYDFTLPDIPWYNN